MTLHCERCNKNYKLPRTYNRHPCVKEGAIQPYQEPPLEPVLASVLQFPPMVQMAILDWCETADLYTLYESGYLTQPALLTAFWEGYWKQHYLQFQEAKQLPRPLTEATLNSGPCQYMRLITRRCFECGTDSGTRSDHFYGYQLCRPCHEKYPEKYNCIVKTRAKTEYCLSDKQLEQLPGPLHAVNPHYRTGPSMLLYLEADCRQLAHRLWGGPEQLKEKLKKRTDSRQNRRQTIAEARASRRQTLSAALRAVGLQIREDSQLCQGYIDDTLEDWSLNAIVAMMVEMHWLFNYTPYKKALDLSVEASARDIYEYEGHWGTAYRLAREGMEPVIRRDTLRQHPIPKQLPWLLE